MLQLRTGRLDQRQQVQPETVVANDPDDAQRSAAQGVGIAGAARPFADGEKPGELVELVGERDGDRDGRGGHRIVRTLGGIVIADRVGDQPVLAVVQRVVAAHHPLQLGELADHAGHEVGLGERRGAPGKRRVGPHKRRNAFGEMPQPGNPFALAAEPGVEGDVVERLHPGIEPGLAVPIPEVSRIGEAGPQHALVAGDDRHAAVNRLDIGDEGEVGRWTAVGVSQGEIALVDAHRDLHDLGRQVHIGEVDAPKQRHRPLDQAGHFVQQTGIIDCCHTMRGSEPRNAVCDHALAVAGLHQHVPVAQLGLPIGEGRHRDRTGRMEAVALGQVGCGEPMAVIGAIAQIERHDLAVEQADDPSQRPHPGEGAGAAPSHRFRPREATQQRRNRRGDQRGRRHRLGHLLHYPVVALLAELVPAGAMLAQKTSHRLLRCIGSRAALAALGGGHFPGNLGCQGDPSRPVVRMDVLGLQRRQCLAAQPRQIFGAACLHACRNLLAEQLQE